MKLYKMWNTIPNHVGDTRTNYFLFQWKSLKQAVNYIRNGVLTVKKLKDPYYDEKFGDLFWFERLSFEEVRVNKKYHWLLSTYARFILTADDGTIIVKADTIKQLQSRLEKWISQRSLAV